MSAEWRPEGQRIPPLEPDQWDERARSVLAPTREHESYRTKVQWKYATSLGPVKARESANSIGIWAMRTLSERLC